MYNSWTLRYFTHTLAQATGAAKYEVNVIDSTDQHDALYREMYSIVASYNSWADDGFVRYIKFQFEDNNTHEKKEYRYDFSDASRKFSLSA